MIPALSIQELNQELAGNNPPTLIDVRESDELEISRFPAFKHIPMNELPSRLGELDRDGNFVIVCRTGNRSGRVTAYMLQAGFKQVRNLDGGINAWVRAFDPTQSTY